MGRFRYTEEHLKFLEKKYKVMTITDLTMEFNKKFGLSKAVCAISTAVTRYNLTCGRTGKDRLMPDRRIYKEEHEEFIRDNYSTMTRKDLTEAFNAKFKMSVSEDSIKCLIANRTIPSGRTGRFIKGHTTWNAGTKGKGLTSSNKTSFKKGSIPANRRPMYWERVDSKDGYVLIKVPEKHPQTGFPTRFKHKHVWLYEYFKGPVPKGHAVVFLDGDKRMFDPDNLVAVKRADLLRLNKYGYKGAPDEVKPSIMALARLETVTGELLKSRGQMSEDRGQQR